MYGILKQVIQYIVYAISTTFSYDENYVFLNPGLRRHSEGSILPEITDGPDNHKYCLEESMNLHVCWLSRDKEVFAVDLRAPGTTGISYSSIVFYTGYVNYIVL